MSHHLLDKLIQEETRCIATDRGLLRKGNEVRVVDKVHISPNPWCRKSKIRDEDLMNKLQTSFFGSFSLVP